MNTPSNVRKLGMLLWCALLSCSAAIAQSSPKSDSVEVHARELIHAGRFADAIALLKPAIAAPDAPIVDGPAAQLEIIRRIRHDFALTPEKMLEKIRRSIPDATPADLDRWRNTGVLQAREIDGEIRYFRSEPANLFRLSNEARKRRAPTIAPAGYEFDLPRHIASLLESAQSAQSADSPFVRPVRHRVRYELSVNDDHPRVKPGAKVRCWLPFPQEYRQQRDVRLISTDPPGGVIAPNATPQRTVYFEHTIGDDRKPPRFTVEFEYTCSAYVPRLDDAAARPLDPAGDLAREFTAERPPHIVFSSEIRSIVAQAVGDETNPLKKSRRLYRWVCENIRYCTEMEYSTIPSLPAKALAARKGDCGVQAMLFITLCRAAGVPARWQSGWESRPNNDDMHDWAEFYVEPWGWLPADPSYGLQNHPDPAVQEFYFGHLDAYRLIGNLDYARDLSPAKTSFRSEPNDFQRGEIEIDGHNLYFDEWDWHFDVKTTPLDGGIAALEEAFDAVIPAALKAQSIPGAVIAIGRRQNVVRPSPAAGGSVAGSHGSAGASSSLFETWQKAYGFLSLEPARKPMRPDAIFDLASLTKPIATGTSLMQLVEQGKVSLDDPVARFLPDFAEGDKKTITVRQLMTHTSGMPAYLDKAGQDDLRKSAGFPCAAATCQRITALSPGKSPGSVTYSCLNAILCERIIAAVAKQPLDRYSVEQVVAPLKMIDTGFRPAAALRERLVPTTRAAHGSGDGGFLLGQVHDPLAALQDGVSGNAGLFGTAADLARFAQMILNGGGLDGVRILKPETIREMTRAHTPEFANSDGRPVARGLLWEIYPPLPGETGADACLAFGHTGFTGTALRIYPEERVYVIALTNRVHPDEKGRIAEFRKTVWRIAGEQLLRNTNGNK